jgi:hypothetical protein
MPFCRRNGSFLNKEKHDCFVIGCKAKVDPSNSPTCPKCNFKKCSAGHCACDVSSETRNFLNEFYSIFCDHVENEEIEHAKLVMVETWYLHCSKKSR